MTATNHVITGAAISVVVGNLAVALPLAFASHFVLDVLPHYGRDVASRHRRVVIADALITPVVSVLLALLLPAGFGFVAACMFVAYMPDLLLIRYFVREIKGRPVPLGQLADWLQWIQWGERPWGWVFEVPYALIVLVFVLIRGNIV